MIIHRIGLAAGVIISVAMVAFFSLLPHKGWEQRFDVVCVALALYWEGLPNEPEEGLRAIMWSVKNRMASRDFPDTACDVITQDKSGGKKYLCQYTFWCDRKPDWPQNLERYVHRLYLASLWQIFPGEDPTYGANHYWSIFLKKDPAWVEPDIVPDSIIQVGHHYFGWSKNLGEDVPRKLALE